MHDKNKRRRHETIACPLKMVLEPLQDRLYLAVDLVHSAADLSAPRSAMQAVTVGNLALFAGGVVPSSADPSSGTPSDVVDIYNSGTGKWSVAALSHARDDFAATAVGSSAFFAGGQISPDTVDIYSTMTGQWSSAALPTAASFLAATAVGTKAIFAGGESGGDLDAVSIYDTSTGRWTTAHLSQARGDLSALTAGSVALFAGGDFLVQGTQTSTSNRVDLYDDATGTWTTAQFSVPRTDMAATSVGNLAVFAGGIDDENGNITISNVMDIYDSSTGAWSHASMPTAREDFTATSVGPYAIFAGGLRPRKDGSVVADPEVDVYDTTTSTWSIASSLSLNTVGLAATSVNGTGIFAGDDVPGHAGDDINLYTLASEAHPIPAGTVSIQRRGIGSVTLTNLGTGAISRGSYVDVYASRGRTYGPASVLLGGLRLGKSFAVDSSAAYDIALSRLAGLTPGNYHLIAATYSGGTVTPFASDRRTFDIGSAGARSILDGETAAASVFYAQPIISLGKHRSWLETA